MQTIETQRVIKILRDLLELADECEAASGEVSRADDALMAAISEVAAAEAGIPAA